MTRRMAQGQSATTIDKERRIAAALAVSMRIANAKFGGKRYKFWYFDANCGSGHNDQVNAPGSPLVFWRMRHDYLPDMQPVAHFCDRDERAIAALRRRLSRNPEMAASKLLHCDNEDGVGAFADILRRSGENPQFLIGAALFDPNGYYWRSRAGLGVPVQALTWFPAAFPRVDLIFNLNMRTYFLQRGAGHSVAPPRDVLASLHRKHWLVARAGGQNRHLLAVGRNMAVRDHRALGFYDVDSDEGRRLLNVNAWSDPQFNLFGDVA